MRRLLGHLLWLVPAVAALGVYFVRNYAGLYYNDAMDLAQLARNIANGQGYVTGCVRPLAWAVSHGANLHQQPELYHAPLFPLLLGVLFVITGTAGGAHDLVPTILSATFHIGTIVLAYAFGRRLFGHRAGALAAVLVGVNLQLIASALSGLAASLAIFLVLLGLYLLYTNQGSAKRTVAAGVVWGLACQADYACVLPALAALVLAVILAPQGRLRHGLAFAVPLVVVQLPWAYRNAMVVGNPFFTLKLYWLSMYNLLNPGASLMHSTDAAAAGPWSFLREHPKALATKWIYGVKSLLDLAPALPGAYLAAFLVAGLVRRLADSRAMVLRNWVVIAVLAQVAAAAAFNPSIELLTPLLGAIIVLAAGYFALFTADLAVRRQQLVTAALLLVACLPLLANLATSEPVSNPSRAGFDYLKRNFQPDAVIATDIPWAVSWYTGLTAVWLPTSLEDTDRLDGDGQITAVYLSLMLPSYPAAERMLLWQQMYRGMTTLNKFTLQAALPPGEYIFRRSNAPEANGG